MEKDFESGREEKHPQNLVDKKSDYPYNINMKYYRFDLNREFEGGVDMATSSITKNFIVSGTEQVEKFADAIEESYQESLNRPKHGDSLRYRELRDPDEIKKFMEKWKKAHA